MGWCYKVNTVSLTVDISGSSGSCSSLWGKREQGGQTNSNQGKHRAIVCQRSFVCHPPPQNMYFLYSLNQTWWNDKALFHTAWRSYPWNEICVANPDLQYISQDILLQTFTAHWLRFNSLSMVQYIEVRPIRRRGIMNLSACQLQIENEWNSQRL